MGGVGEGQPLHASRRTPSTGGVSRRSSGRHSSSSRRSRRASAPERPARCDIALQVPPDLVEDVRRPAPSSIAPASRPGLISLHPVPQSTLGGGAPLNDLRVRQAINHAVDVDKIIKFILDGQAVRVATLYGRQTSRLRSRGQKPYEYNPQKARSCWPRRGFANGFTIGLDAPIGGNPIKPVEVAQAVAADPREGRDQDADADAGHRDLRADEVRLQARAHPHVESGWPSRPTASCTRRRTPGAVLPLPRALRRRVDRLDGAERSELNPTKRLAVLKAIQQKVRDDAPFLVLYQQRGHLRGEQAPGLELGAGWLPLPDHDQVPIDVRRAAGSRPGSHRGGRRPLPLRARSRVIR